MTFLPRTRILLAQAGLAPLELEALSHPMRHQLPAQPGGFGLIGPTGTGKTWGLVVLMARMVDQCIRQQPDPSRAALLWIDGPVARDHRLRWVIWLDMARQIRARKDEKRWVWDMAELMREVPFLVLDDLGREERSQREDLAQEVLQEVLEHRHRHRMPLWWTSNRTREELTAFYGGPLASRLLGTWPDYEVEGQDMRLFPVGGEA